MKQLIFIAGRGHSGTTLLDLMLSGHPRLIGVGEIFSLFDSSKDFLNRLNEVFCSCGKQMDQCEFWAPTSAILHSAYKNKATSKELCSIFLSSFYKHFGTDAIPVDISKTDEALEVLKSLNDINVKVIFLIRDVRSWTISMRDLARREKNFEISDLIKKHGWKAFRYFIQRMSVKFFLHWYILNQRTQKLLNKLGLSTIQIGYEELCLYPELIMKKISSFLELDYNENMLSLIDMQSHVILGNRMRAQKEKRQRVAYDNRWFYQSDWMGPAVIFPYIMRYNMLEVYRNIRSHMWNI